MAFKWFSLTVTVEKNCKRDRTIRLSPVLDSPGSRLLGGDWHIGDQLRVLLEEKQGITEREVSL